VAADNEPSVEEIVAAALLRDAEAHAAGRFNVIGDSYDDVYGQILPLIEEPVTTVQLAFNFWDGWVDASNHEWQYYDGISREDWPRMAREIALALQAGKEITNPMLLERFGPRPRRSLRHWLVDFVRRQARPR
jgi:hypothetical protein